MADRIARYDAWRLREPVDRPMLGLIWEPDIPPLPEFVEQLPPGVRSSATQIRPELFLPHVERWYQRARALPGDVIQRFTPAFGIPWVEAIAGCPVTAHPGSLWAEPCLANYEDRPTVRLDPDNPWLQRLIELSRAMVEMADGRFPVAAPQMRGPLDTLAAMRTPAQMCLDLVERPDETFKLLGELAELWISIGRAVLAAIPPFQGGHIARMGTWAPGPIITLQNDVSTLVSPRTYRELVLPWDRKIVAAFPYTEYHVHASECQQVGNFLELDELTAIEFTLEHTIGGRPLQQMIPLAMRILHDKPLLLAAPDLASAECCLTELPPAGLCIMLAVSGSEIPPEYCRWLEAHCRERPSDA